MLHYRGARGQRGRVQRRESKARLVHVQDVVNVSLQGVQLGLEVSGQATIEFKQLGGPTGAELQQSRLALERRRPGSDLRDALPHLSLGGRDEHRREFVPNRADHRLLECPHLGQSLPG